MLDRRASYLYGYIRKCLFEQSQFESLEADWGQKLEYHRQSGKVKACIKGQNGQWRFGQTVDDMSVVSNDSEDSEDSGADYVDSE